MSQIAGFRGAVWDASKVALAEVAAAPIADPSGKLAAGALVRDPTRAVYRYHQAVTAGPRVLVRASWFAALGLEPLANGGPVRAHEATDAGARDRAIAGIAAAGIHTDAVLVGYRDPAREVDRLFRKTEGERPLIDVTTADGTAHKLWRVNSAEVIGKLRPLLAPKPVYVLDGHARYEGMVAYRDRLAAAAPLAMYATANYGLACLVNLDDPALAIGARHRIARGEGIGKAAVLAAAKPHFIIDVLPRAAKDASAQVAALEQTIAHQPAFVATFAGDADAYKLTLSPDANPAALGANVHRAIQKLDAVVADRVFAPLAAPRATWQTALEPSAVVAAVTGGAPLGLVMRPVPLEQVAHAADLGALLPFGSTAFHPAVARLLAYVVDRDEDVI